MAMLMTMFMVRVALIDGCIVTVWDADVNGWVGESQVWLWLLLKACCGKNRKAHQNGRLFASFHLILAGL